MRPTLARLQATLQAAGCALCAGLETLDLNPVKGAAGGAHAGAAAGDAAGGWAARCTLVDNPMSEPWQSAQVRPTLARLQATLLAAGGALVLGSGLLLSLVLGSADADGVYGAPRVYCADTLCEDSGVLVLG